MKCIDCESMKITPIEDGCGAAVKCFRTSKKGKTITWAMTVVSLGKKKVKIGSLQY